MSRRRSVQWSERAAADWMALSLPKATLVAEAVDVFAQTGRGPFIATSPTEFILTVDHLNIMIIVDDDTIHVDAIHRS